MPWTIPMESRPGYPINIPNKYVGNRLLAALPEQAIALLAPDLRQSTLPQGVVCYGAGDPIDQVYFPRTGMISLLVTTGDGDMVEIGSVGCEGAVGVQCGNGPCFSFTRAIVQIGGNFWIIAAPLFEAATSRSAELRELIFAYIETLWAETQQNAACNAIHDGSSRLCRWLLQCADRTGSDQVLLTHEFLAEMLGVRRTTVTLLAQELQKRGIFRYSRGRITILDRAALEACACECYEVIRKLSTVAVLPTPSHGSPARKLRGSSSVGPTSG
jgi:CRP-like cAMP-binding protein